MLMLNGQTLSFGRIMNLFRLLFTYMYIYLKMVIMWNLERKTSKSKSNFLSLINCYWFATPASQCLMYSPAARLVTVLFFQKVSFEC